MRHKSTSAPIKGYKSLDNQDLRIQRTRRLLKEALIELVIEKGYDNISIRDVTDRAQIGYRTFFRHYDDLKALLYDVLEDVITTMRQVMVPSRELDIVEENLRQWYRIVEKDADLYRVLFGAPNYQELIQPLITFTEQSTKNVFRNLDIPHEIISTHSVSASLSLVRWWLANDMSISADTMAHYVMQLVIRPIIELIPEN